MADYDLSDADLEQMYQEVILEASKHPHGKASFAPDITSADAEEGEASADQASAKKTIGDQAGRGSQSVLTGSSTQSPDRAVPSIQPHLRRRSDHPP